jgi:hypothetical protein
MNSRMEVIRGVFRESIARWTYRCDQFTSAAPALSLFRQNELTEPISDVYELSICMVVQVAYAL